MRRIEDFIIRNLIQNEHNEIEKSKLIYGVRIILSDLYKILSVYILAIILDCFVEVLITHFTFYILRQVCFGYHFKSNTECLLASVFLFTLLTKFISLTKLSDYFLLFIAILSLVLLLIYAPVGTKKHPIVSRKHQLYLRGKMYKRILILFIIIFFIPSDYRKFIYLGIIIEAIMILLELLLGGKNNYKDD